MSAKALTALGTGSALAVAGRSSTALLWEDGGRQLLIDCGGNAPHQLLEAGSNAGNLAGVFLTHSHPDHILGFPLLVQQRKLLGAVLPFFAAANEGTLETAQGLLSVFGLERAWEAIGGEWICVEGTRQAPLFLPGFQGLETFPVEHGTKPTLGISARWEGGSWAYSSDSKPCPSLQEAAQGVDLLLHDCTFPEGEVEFAGVQGHGTPSTVGVLAGACQVKELALVHIGPGWEPEREGLPAIRRHFSGKVTFPKDGQRWEWSG